MIRIVRMIRDTLYWVSDETNVKFEDSYHSAKYPFPPQTKNADDFRQ